MPEGNCRFWVQYAENHGSLRLVPSLDERGPAADRQRWPRRRSPVVKWQGQTMGSGYTVKIVGTNLAPAPVEALKAEVEQRLKEVNRQMSHYQADSELS